MSLAHALSSFALDQLLDGACKAVGVPGTEALAGFLKRHFSDHSAKFDKALQTANERAWKALELALEGNSFWARCNAVLSQGDQKAFAHQVRTFLEKCSLDGLQGQRDEVREACLRDLRAARKARLLDVEGGNASGLAAGVSALARFSDPQQRSNESMRALAGIAATLKEAGYAYLAWLVSTQPTADASLLVTAVRFFFRREVESDQELWRGLAWASWQQIGKAQEEGFACLGAALMQNGKRLEELLAGTHRAVLDILDEVKGQKAQIAGVAKMVLELLNEHRMANRELRPQDSLSMRSGADRARVEQLVAWFRKIPPEQQARLPALLNGLGKLQHASGDFIGAQTTFAQVAAGAPDAEAKAEAHQNAYLSAVERRDWEAALQAFRSAARLSPGRFQLFQPEKYEPLRILGAGGFGVAFLCQHRHTGGLRVIKTLRADALAPQTVERIVEEAKALEGVRHESVITLHDCEYADVGRTRLYLVMEYFDGEPLADFIVRQGALSQRDALDLARRIAEGLHAAHQRGILHRDIKPANVLVKRDGDDWKVKIIDFGLALQEKASEATAGTVTVSARGTTLDEIAGTIDYAAPEQIGRLPGVQVDRRADIFGFGRTCCYALFKSPNPKGRQWRALPKGIANWLDSCLEELPEDRPGDFAQVLQMMGQIRLKRPGGGKADPTPQPTLIVSRGLRVNEEYPLSEGRNVLGRSGTDIDLEDQESPERCYISREHCAVHLSKGQLSLEDLNSANGTYLNRARVQAGTVYPLKTDDLIQLGTLVLKVRE